MLRSFKAKEEEIPANLAPWLRQLALATLSDDFEDPDKATARIYRNPGNLFSFAVTPNSLGDGGHDILLCGRIGLFRSIDGGYSWEFENDAAFHSADVIHVDTRALAFGAPPPGSTIPPRMK